MEVALSVSCAGLPVFVSGRLSHAHGCIKIIVSDLKDERQSKVRQQLVHCRPRQSHGLPPGCSQSRSLGLRVNLNQPAPASAPLTRHFPTGLALTQCPAVSSSLVTALAPHRLQGPSSLNKLGPPFLKDHSLKHLGNNTSECFDENYRIKDYLNYVTRHGARPMRGTWSFNLLSLEKS